jgi:Domain of unknown function (DUF6985)
VDGMSEVDDPVIGRIRLNHRWWECVRHVPFLDATLQVRIDPEQRGGDVSDKQRHVYQSIMRLPAATQTLMEAPIFANYLKIRDLVEDDTMPDIAEAAGIWSQLDLRAILIPRHRASKHSYFFVEAECTWEPEHGLEVLFRDGGILQVTQQEGLASNQAWSLRYINE